MHAALYTLCLLVPLLAHAQEGGTAVSPHTHDDDPSDLTSFYQEGLTQWGLYMGWGVQHNLPTGPRSGLVGDTVAVSYGRFRSRRDVWGLELGYGRIRAIQEHVSAVSAQVSHIHHFSLEPRRAAFWDLGLGLMHFDKLVREQATHTNFVEHVGCGLTWPDGDDGAWSVRYRFLHVSNAGRKHPNIGLNSSLFAVGHIWFR